jgi:hypothetical protein
MSFYGLGALRQGTKEAGGDFNCTATSCYAIGTANDALFKNLQNLLNLAAKLKNITTRIGVDGLIGASTVNLAKQVYLKYSPQQLSALWDLTADGSPMTKEGIARMADQIVPQLQRAVGQTSPQGVAVAPVQATPGAVMNPYPYISTVPTPPGTPIVQTNPPPLPTTPSIPTWGLEPGQQVPSAGPHITVPNASLPTSQQPIIVNAGAGLSTGAAIGIGMIALGLIGGVVYALKQR